MEKTKERQLIAGARMYVCVCVCGGGGGGLWGWADGRMGEMGERKRMLAVQCFMSVN